jgi:hypothetical protein
MRKLLQVALISVVADPALAIDDAKASLLNVLSLEPTAASLYVKPGEQVVVDMNASNLQQMVNGCQALLGYSSTYFPAAGQVAPGGGVWTEMLYESWNVVEGDLDTAVGVTLDGPIGTMADGTVAVITLTAGPTEGVTRLVFRPDGEYGYATMFSDLSANPVWPSKLDSAGIVIDGTPPTIAITSATQNAQELLGTGAIAVQGDVTITVEASDNFGLTGAPAVKVTDANGVENILTASGSGPWTYTYPVTAATANGLATITAGVSDAAGNTASDSDTFMVDKNQAAGTVSFLTLRSGPIISPPSPADYTLSQVVTFVATDGAGGVLKTWTPVLTFANNPATQTASASFSLTQVPAGTARLSAKTAGHLRKRVDAVLDGNGQVAPAFVLLGGDVNGDNFVNILDYSLMKSRWNSLSAIGDINGDGQVQLLDYQLMQAGWFKTGDAQ